MNILPREGPLIPETLGLLLVKVPEMEADT
jgi:hypothetical protein